MKCEKELVQLLVAVSLIAWGISACGIPCPKSPGFRLTDEAREKCEEKIEESFDECWKYVLSLLDKENLTDQQRFDLADGLKVISWSGTREDDEFLRLRSLQEYRILHEKFPDDVQVSWYLSLLEDGETSLQFQRRIAQLAPDCNLNNRYFAEDLDRQIGWGRDRTEQDEDLVQELVSVLDQGYEHAERRWDKMNFGHRRYREYLLAGEQDLAEIFWNQVVAELDPGSFPQDNTYSHGWTILCGEMGFKFRFAGICLDTIEKTLKEALESQTNTVDYAILGARLLVRQLLFPWGNTMFVLNPSPPRVHEVSYKPYTAGEGARILMRLRDLMESVPKDSRTESFDKTYNKILGQKPPEDPTPVRPGYELVPSPSDPDIWIWERL